MAGGMAWVLGVCLAAFTLLFVYLLVVRSNMVELNARLDALALSEEEEGGDQ